jgi:cellobiose-specific phosphotransferase system component IIC
LNKKSFRKKKKRRALVGLAVGLMLFVIQIPDMMERSANTTNLIGGMTGGLIVALVLALLFGGTTGFMALFRKTS